MSISLQVCVDFLLVTMVTKCDIIVENKKINKDYNDYYYFN